MKLSYTAVWEDTLALARSHLPLVIAVAGVFIFLPNLLIGYFVPEPQPTAQTLPAVLAAMNLYWRESWMWLLLSLITNMIGTLAILILVFDRRRPTVAGAIAGAMSLLPFYLVASLLSGVLLMLALLALIIPALYVYGRLATLGPVVVAEGRRNPVDAIKRSFEVTKGSGWSTFGLLLVVSLAAGLVILAISTVAGLVFVLLLGQELGKFLVLILSTALEAVLTALLVLLVAAIYRRLTAETSPAAVFE